MEWVVGMLSAVVAVIVGANILGLSFDRAVAGGVGYAGSVMHGQEGAMVDEVRKAGGASAVTVTGEVVPGVECPAIRTDDGRQIALSHLPAPFQLGDRVTVRGSGYAGSATCQQEVLVVEGVSRAQR